MKSGVLIAGGSGYIGRHLTRALLNAGHEVSWLSRNPVSKHKIPQYAFDPKRNIVDPKAFQNIHALINLCGAPINGKRWNREYKQQIYESRVTYTKALHQALIQSKEKIEVYLQTSASGYYGYAKSESVLSETDAAGADFLAQTCVDWEKAGSLFEADGIRTVLFRTGILFAKDSEAFKQLALPIRWGVGAVAGSGNQIFNWIHPDDLCAIFEMSVRNEKIRGVYNAVAPENISNRELTKGVAAFLKRPILLPPVPKWVIQLLFGELSGALLNGNKISSEKIISSGFRFRNKTIADVLDVS